MVQAWKDAGLYKLLIPARFGGEGRTAPLLWNGEKILDYDGPLGEFPSLPSTRVSTNELSWDDGVRRSNTGDGRQVVRRGRSARSSRTTS